MRMTEGILFCMTAAGLRTFWVEKPCFYTVWRNCVGGRKEVSGVMEVYHMASSKYPEQASLLVVARGPSSRWTLRGQQQL